MTTNYDPIAEQYQRSKQAPWRVHIEAHTLLGLLGDLRGLEVLDAACGEGFYTRRLRQLGAARVTGIDLSPGMIALAQQQELQHALGITYEVGDAGDLPYEACFDLVVAAYLLNYAPDKTTLEAMARSIVNSLKPGGRFITVNSSPALHFPSAPSYLRYGFEAELRGPFIEGAPICWRFHLEDGPFEIENYFLDTAVHEQALKAAGFSKVIWHAPRLAESATRDHPPAHWADFMRASPIAFLECIR